MVWRVAFLTSLLPGVREVRAPLVAGYLWVLFGWLLADPAKPEAVNGDLYDRLGAVSQAVGPVGQAIAASVLAYLLGSVMTSVTVRGVQAFVARWRRDHLFRDYYSPPPLDDHGRLSLDSLALMAGIGPGQGEMPGWRGYMAGPEPDPPLDRAILAITDRELGEERRKLEAALESLARQAGDESIKLEHRSRGAAELVALDVLEGDGMVRREFVVPRFSAERDLFSEFPILRARLLEQAETIGMQIERIYAEAEFRFAVSPPLVALALLFATNNLFWLITLLAPLALVIQGLVFEREGERQVIDALRARSGTPELELITPVFARYRNDAHLLREALDQARWTPD
jgi:hypothetical protein